MLNFSSNLLLTLNVHSLNINSYLKFKKKILQGWLILSMLIDNLIRLIKCLKQREPLMSVIQNLKDLFQLLNYDRGFVYLNLTELDDI